MNSQIIDAKCPYCKAEFKTSAFGSGSWAQNLWGQYAPNQTAHKCESCGETSLVSVKQIYKYSARKVKKPTDTASRT